MQSPISIFIICKNEERIIERCLSQANKLASELIIVDSGSTDRTLEIAAKYTKQIYQQEWLGYGKQKNFALSKCSNEWVLSLDADEILTDELIIEIQALDFKAVGYQIARKFFIGERFIRWGGYYPDYQLRLFRKSQGKFCDSPVHESVELYSTETKKFSKDRTSCPKLKEPLNHYAYQNITEMEEAYNKYAALNPKAKNPAKAIANCVFTFINKFFLRLAFLNGMLGFKLALIHSKYSYKKYI